MNRRTAARSQSVDELSEVETQLRGVPMLRPGEADELLVELRQHGTPAASERLVEGHLGIALEEARARDGRGVDGGDLYQEATLAVIVAVREYASREASAAGLGDFTRKVVAAHLDATLEAAEMEHQSEEAFVRDAQLYEAAEITLRRRLGRAATPTEVASLLEWPAERVEMMARMLGNARSLYDEDIALYLDDE